MSNKTAGAAFAIFGIVLIIIGAVVAFNYYYVAIPQYQRVMGDYALNAGDAPTLQEAGHWLQLFNDSMNREGLTSTMYNSPWSWDQTPQNRMDFQYKYISDIINIRLPYYQKLANSTSCGFNDCYNLAITNFRAELNHNGPPDWVANGAWIIKNGYYWLPYIATGLIIPGVFFLAIGVIIGPDWDFD